MARSTAGLVVGGLLGATALLLAGCGTDGGGSVALGDGAPAPALTTPANSGVVFVPLDSPTPGGGASSAVPAAAAPGVTPAASSGSGGGSGSGSNGGAGGPGGGSSTTGGTPNPPGRGTGTGGGTGGGAAGGTGQGGSGGTSQTPADLTVAALHTADTAQRWCQHVTLTLVNSGDRGATSDTVTFATHVIGALGVDWWTYETSQPLAAPVAGHTSAVESWTVCLDSWRVPAGMHLETRAATLG